MLFLPWTIFEILKKIIRYLFLAGPSFLPRLFSSCGEQGLLFSCSTRASHCGGLFCWGAQALLGRVGFSSCGYWDLEHRFLSCGMGSFAPQHVRSSSTRDGTHATCTVWPILYHWATREAPLLKSLLVTVLLLFYVLVLWLGGMWDLRSLTSDGTIAHLPPPLAGEVLTIGPDGKVQNIHILFKKKKKILFLYGL